MSRRSESPGYERPPLYGRRSPSSGLQVISPTSSSSSSSLPTDQDVRSDRLPIDPLYLHPDALVPDAFIADDFSVDSNLSNEWSPMARAPFHRRGAQRRPSSLLWVPSLNDRAATTMSPVPQLSPRPGRRVGPRQVLQVLHHGEYPPPPPLFVPNLHRVQRFREMGFVSPDSGNLEFSDDEAGSLLDDENFREEQEQSPRVRSRSDTSSSEEVQCELGGIVGALAKIFKYFYNSNRHLDSSPRNLMEQCMICPIRQEIMWDPVVDPDGHSYEREAIMEWLSMHSTSPITRKALTAKDLRPNRALQAVILQYMKARPSPDADEEDLT